MKFLLSIILLWGLNFPSFATDLPSRIDISYSVKTGIGNGEMNETMEIKRGNGSHSYSITSEARASGVMKLIKPGSIKRDSQGTITSHGLQPIRFSDQRGKKSSRVAVFDWENHLLVIQSKDEEKQKPLPVGTLDRLSFSYNFMFSSPRKFVDAHITDGRSLQLARYAVNEELLETPIGKIETIVLTKQEQEHDKLKRKIWLATNHHMLPVRIVSTEEDGLELEIIVTNINVSYLGDH